MTPVELALRLTVAVALILAPTAMFLGFWRLLMRLRNGELVERVLADERVEEEWSGGQFAAPALVGAFDDGRSSDSRCPNCGASNPERARFCSNCLSRL